MNNLKEQYYIQLDSQDQNISITKVKNAITKQVSKRIADLLQATNKDDIKQLEKSIKSNIYDTCTLISGCNNIEVAGIFNKTESKKVMFKSLIKDVQTQKIEYKEIEGEKINSKVYPNLDLYLTEYAYGKGYNIIFEGLQIGYTRTKNIKDIEESLQNINMTETELVNKINESLVQLGVKEQTLETETIKNNTVIDNITTQKDDIRVNTIATTNIKDNNINVNSDSIKLSKKDISNNIYNTCINNETGSCFNTG
jgi:hypothetical protein